MSQYIIKGKGGEVKVGVAPGVVEIGVMPQFLQLTPEKAIELAQTLYVVSNAAKKEIVVAK